MPAAAARAGACRPGRGPAGASRGVGATTISNNSY